MPFLDVEPSPTLAMTTFLKTSTRDSGRRALEARLPENQEKTGKAYPSVPRYFATSALNPGCAPDTALIKASAVTLPFTTFTTAVWSA